MVIILLYVNFVSSLIGIDLKMNFINEIKVLRMKSFDGVTRVHTYN